MDENVVTMRMLVKNTNALETLTQGNISGWGIPGNETFIKFFMWFWLTTRFQKDYSDKNCLYPQATCSLPGQTLLLLREGKKSYLHQFYHPRPKLGFLWTCWITKKKTDRKKYFKEKKKMEETGGPKQRQIGWISTQSNTPLQWSVRTMIKK